MPSAKQPRSPNLETLQAIPYENTAFAKPPIPVEYPTKSHPNKTVNRLRKSRSLARVRPPSKDDTRKDSGLETSSSSARASRTTLPNDAESTGSSIRKSASLPSFRAHRDSRPPSTPRTPKSPISTPKSRHDGMSSAGTDSPAFRKLETASPQFLGLKTEIPTGSFEDLTAPGLMDFSKRGSMLLGGKKAVAKREDIANGRVIGSRRQQNPEAQDETTSMPSRVLSTDEVAVSNRVRSMYEDGGLAIGDWPLGKETLPEPSLVDHPALSNGHPSIRITDDSQPNNGGPTSELGEYGPATERIHSILRQANELAGGIEDWEDVNNGDVDRYGFIVPRKLSSTASSLNSEGKSTVNPPRMHRTSTLLLLASETPRRSTSKRSKRQSTRSPARSSELPSPRSSRFFRPASAQSQNTTRSAPSNKSGQRSSRFLPNKSRRTLDEAGDMLTLPPGLADIAEDLPTPSSPVHLSTQKRREYERDEKWRKMAKSTRDIKGSGTSFTFDTHNPKLIERTWKGIPDKWRATAWHSFLTSSAQKRGGGKQAHPSDDELKAAFADLLEEPSPDDMQIDIDVPRTISSHIMFRRRYRGGQRLLFRVLHCMSLYFPSIGYVQGMAALVATLLCYFDEEMAFVMMVRLWMLRGLEKLYKSGFEGLMRALEDFEDKWLGGQGSGGGWGKDVKAKLDEMGITGTSYGTRWYLTLFNYSIPFPAQLRVWDIFMLLGDEKMTSAPTKQRSKQKQQANGTPVAAASENFNGGLDVLHAVSLALIDGMREILLDSDFENAMKTLTSWIPVRDEECLMRVARCEWKVRRGK